MDKRQNAVMKVGLEIAGYEAAAGRMWNGSMSDDEEVMGKILVQGFQFSRSVGCGNRCDRSKKGNYSY
jgi:hypothetical protein